MKHTLSYAYLDGNDHESNSPWHFEFEAKDDEEKEQKIKEIVDKIFDEIFTHEINSEADYEEYWHDKPNPNKEEYDKWIDDKKLTGPHYWNHYMPEYKDEVINHLSTIGYWV